MKQQSHGGHPRMMQRRKGGCGNGPGSGNRRGQGHGHHRNRCAIVGNQRPAVPVTITEITDNIKSVAKPNSALREDSRPADADDIARMPAPSRTASIAAPIVCVIPEACTGCAMCTEVCPTDSIRVLDGLARVEDDCIACGACVEECPEGALTMVGTG